jgi:hypothetical protein
VEDYKYEDGVDTPTTKDESVEEILQMSDENSDGRREMNIKINAS